MQEEIPGRPGSVFEAIKQNSEARSQKPGEGRQEKEARSQNSGERRREKTGPGNQKTRNRPQDEETARKTISRVNCMAKGTRTCSVGLSTQ
jgi:hypothetical protein